MMSWSSTYDYFNATQEEKNAIGHLKEPAQRPGTGLTPCEDLRQYTKYQRQNTL